MLAACFAVVFHLIFEHHLPFSYGKSFRSEMKSVTKASKEIKASKMFSESSSIYVFLLKNYYFINLTALFLRLQILRD